MKLQATPESLSSLTASAELLRHASVDGIDGSIHYSDELQQSVRNEAANASLTRAFVAGTLQTVVSTVDRIGHCSASSGDSALGVAHSMGLFAVSSSLGVTTAAVTGGTASYSSSPPACPSIHVTFARCTSGRCCSPMKVTSLHQRDRSRCLLPTLPGP